MKFEWEEMWKIDASCRHYEDISRAKVIGGWLIKHIICNNYTYGDIAEDGDDNEGWRDVKSQICFIPDSEHLWEIDKE